MAKGSAVTTAVDGRYAGLPAAIAMGFGMGYAALTERVSCGTALETVRRNGRRTVPPTAVSAVFHTRRQDVTARFCSGRRAITERSRKVPLVVERRRCLPLAGRKG